MMKYCLILVIILSIFSFASRAQYGSFGLTDARQLGLGNTYATNSRELYAAGKNPSLLAYRVSDRELSILFPSLSARAYNISKVTNFFNDFFSQRPLEIITGIDGSIIKKAFENGGKLSLGLQIGFLAVGYTPGEKIGAFSFAMKDYLKGFIQLPKSLVKYNNSKGDFSAVYFKDFAFKISWIRSYELSYGKAFYLDPGTGIQAVYAGLGVKYINGYMYNDIRFSGGAGYKDVNGILTGAYKANATSAYSDDINIDNAFNGEEVVSNAPFMDPVGQGFGIDLGLTLLLNPGLKVGVSVTDAGFIDWRGKTKKTLISGVIRLDSTLSLDDIDSLAKLIVIEKESENDFRTQPPCALHLGFSFMVDRFVRNFPGELNVAFEIHQGISRAIENPEQPRLALGVDWKPGSHWPVFLTGITNGQIEDLSWSLGIGYELKFLEIYIASPNMIPTFKGESMQSLSLSMCWHFIKNKPDIKRD